MNVLSLFDGISCGRVALERANIPVDKYYASEIDKYAIQVAQKNYPDTIQLGDINNWHEWDIDWKSIDLVIGGSPCQGFSNAGKGLNFDDPRSRLFFVFTDILNHIRVQNPKVLFLLENVKMKKEWVNVISSYLGVEPVEINSSLVSAQNRQRLYWTNISNIEQPQDKGIKLKDILTTGVPYSDKSYALTASYGNAVIWNSLERKQRTMVAEPVNVCENGNEDKSRPLTCHYSNNFGGWYERMNDLNPNKQQIDILAEPLDICDYVKNKIDKITEKYGYLPEQFNPYNECEIKDKSPTLTSNCGSQTNSSCVLMFDKVKYLNESNVKQLVRSFGSKGQIVTAETEKTPTLIASMGMGGGNGLYYAEKGTENNVFEVKDHIIIIYGKEYKINLSDGLWHIRKLCPIECERLQTLPDNYTYGLSNTQRYKCLGNGWTVDVIAHIFRHIPQN